MKNFLFTALFLCVSVLAIAGTGRVKGTVTDAKTGEPIIGANVIITGTTTGTVTQWDGTFSLEGLDPGSYSITVSFISYEPKVFSEVAVAEVTPAVLNVGLSESTVDIGEVAVTTQKIKHSEAALVTMQQKSATMLDGISAQEMSLSGSSNAASSLSKVTGVTVQDGKYVYVRGLGDRYLKTQLNGAEIPSLDPNKNSVQLDIFPSNIIDNLVVYKTFSPELPASFTGGYVNITTKDFPDKLTVQFGIGLGFNPQVHLRNDFLTYSGGKMDKLGFDDGTRALPSGIEVQNYPKYPQDRDGVEKATKSFNKTMSPTTKMSGLDNSYNLSLGNKFKVGKRYLGVVSSLSYSNSYGFYDDGTLGRYELATASSERLDTKKNVSEIKGTEKVLIGGLVSATYRINGYNKVGINLIRNQSGIKEARVSEGYSSYHEVDMTSRKLSFLQRSFSSAQLFGVHKLKPYHNAKLKWLSAVSYSRQEEPDTRYFNNITEYVKDDNNNVVDTLYSIEASKDKLPARYFRDMKEINSDNRLDLIVPVGSDAHDSKIMIGGGYMYKVRDFSEVLYEYYDNNSSFNGSIDEYIADGNVGRDAATYDANTGLGYGVYMKEFYTESNNYTADMMLVSDYINADIYLTEKLRLSGGVRLEYCKMSTISENEDVDEGSLDDLDMLPAVNFTYHPMPEMNLKIAATRTLARPSFREMAPFATYDYQTGDMELGNPELKRTLIDNFDIRLERFFGKGEIVSLGYFYKNFTNPIERVFNPKAINSEITFENIPNAQLHGLEFEVKKNLDFIHQIRNVKVGGNLTLVTSTVQIEEKELEAIHATDPGHPDRRAMTGQAPYIVNAFTRYHSDKHKLDAGFTFNISGEKLYMVVKGGTPNVYEKPRAVLDFNAKKKFGEHFVCKMGVKNILNSKLERIITYNDEEYVYSSYSKGVTYSVGFSYLIN